MVTPELKIINSSRFFIPLYKDKLTRCGFSLMSHSFVIIMEISKHKTSKNDKLKLKLVLNVKLSVTSFFSDNS